MKMEHKSFYTKHERKICTVASLIQDTMKNEDVPVAWIDREDTLKALELQQHQGSLAIVSLNKAFDALDTALGITAYDHEFLLVLTNPMVLDIWGEDEEEVEGYLDLDEEKDAEDDDEDDNSRPGIEDTDDNILYDDLGTISLEDGELKDEDNVLGIADDDEDDDDEWNEDDLFEYVCEFCGMYKAYRPRCNKCEVEK
jgi:hypothetical protein